MYPSSNYFFDGRTSGYLSSFQTDYLTSNLDLPDASVSLYEGSQKQKCLPESVYYSTNEAVSSSVCFSHPEFCPSRDSGPISTKAGPSPGYGSCVHDWYPNSRREAKRARVENIIKGMSSTNVPSESLLQSKRLQEHPGYRSDPNSSVASQTDAFTELYGEFDNGPCTTHEGWKGLMNVTRAKPDTMELMTDLLKYELSRAVSSSIDSIFKNVSLLQTSGPAGSLQPPICTGGALSHRVEDVQTEALSLVLPKPAQQKSDSLSLQCGSSNDRAQATESGPKKNARQHAQGRSKVSSRSLRSLSVDPPSLHLHHIKIESDIPANNYLYTLNVSSQESHLNGLRRSLSSVLSLTLPLGGPDRQPPEKSKADVLLHSLPELTRAENLFPRCAGESEESRM